MIVRAVDAIDGLRAQAPRRVAVLGAPRHALKIGPWLAPRATERDRCPVIAARQR